MNSLVQLFSEFGLHPQPPCPNDIFREYTSCPFTRTVYCISLRRKGTTTYASIPLTRRGIQLFQSTTNSLNLAPLLVYRTAVRASTGGSVLSVLTQGRYCTDWGYRALITAGRSLDAAYPYGYESHHLLTGFKLTDHRSPRLAGP